MPPSQVKRKEVESPRRSKSLGGRNPSTLKPCKKPAGGLNPSIINTTKRLEVLGGQNPSTTKITQNDNLSSLLFLFIDELAQTRYHPLHTHVHTTLKT
jgi:hypothetical protein